jgi:hypothetical protein
VPMPVPPLPALARPAPAESWPMRAAAPIASTVPAARPGEPPPPPGEPPPLPAEPPPAPVVIRIASPATTAGKTPTAKLARRPPAAPARRVWWPLALVAVAIAAAIAAALL